MPNVLGTKSRTYPNQQSTVHDMPIEPNRQLLVSGFLFSHVFLIGLSHGKRAEATINNNIIISVFIQSRFDLKQQAAGGQTDPVILLIHTRYKELRRM